MFPYNYNMKRSIYFWPTKAIYCLYSPLRTSVHKFEKIKLCVTYSAHKITEVECSFYAINSAVHGGNKLFSRQNILSISFSHGITFELFFSTIFLLYPAVQDGRVTSIFPNTGSLEGGTKLIISGHGKSFSLFFYFHCSSSMSMLP